MVWPNAVNTMKIFNERCGSGDSLKACESVILFTMQTFLNNILHQKYVGYLSALISDDFSQRETYFFFAHGCFLLVGCYEFSSMVASIQFSLVLKLPS